VVDRYQQRTAQVDTLIRSVFLGGVSTRQVGAILAPLLDDTISASTVSTVTKTLDRAVDASHRRPLSDTFTYLFLDAVSLRVKTPDGTRRRLVLVAQGITPTGQRELIDYRLVRTESQDAWEAFLTSLSCRGLTGIALQLITTDGHRGLHAALDLVYPHVPRQALLGPRTAECRPAPARPRSRALPALGPPNLSGAQSRGRGARAVAVGAGLATGRAPRRRVPAARLGSTPGLLPHPGAGLAPGADHQRHRAGLPGDPAPDAAHDLLHQHRELRADRLCHCQRDE
jgi:hypothetical protein